MGPNNRERRGLAVQQAQIERVTSQSIESSSLVSTGALEAARQRVANRAGGRTPAGSEAFTVGATPGGQALLHGAGRLAWKQDPNMLSLLREAARSRVRYDPGKWTETPWYLDLR